MEKHKLQKKAYILFYLKFTVLFFILISPNTEENLDFSFSNHCSKSLYNTVGSGCLPVCLCFYSREETQEWEYVQS